MSLLFRSWGGRTQGFLLVVGCLMMAMAQSVARADTRLFPIISISEQYDSNVFYAPKSVLAPGLQADDFVTFVNPQLILSHASPSFTGSLSAGGVIGKYVNNPDLDFAGFNAGASIDISQIARRISSRFTSLSFRGAYQFTPAASAFGGGGVGFGGVGFGTTGSIGSGAIGPFDSGQVANRARISSYRGSISGGYALTQLTGVTFGYSYTQISFGNQFGIQNSAVQNQLFETRGHSITAGINTQASLNDTLSLNYVYSIFDQSGGNQFSTHTATGTWARRWTRELSSTLGGGASILEPYKNQSSGVAQDVPLQVKPTVTAVLSWSSASSALKGMGEGGGVFGGRLNKSPLLASSMQSMAGSVRALPGQAGSVAAGTILGRGRYTIALSYNYSIFPSFVAEAGPIQTHVFGAQAALGLTDRVTGQVGINFARSIGSLGGPLSPVFAFDTYGTTEGVGYLVTPNLQVNLTHSWLNFVDSSPDSSTVNNGNQVYGFSKHMVMISLSYVFTRAQGFFRSGGLGGGASVGSGHSGQSEAGIQSDNGSSEKGFK